MEEYEKLYRVTLRGMTSCSTGTSYGISYVVAKDPGDAYKKVKDFLDEHDLGFDSERELYQIELLAENYQYTNTRTMLFL